MRTYSNNTMCPSMSLQPHGRASVWETEIIDLSFDESVCWIWCECVRYINAVRTCSFARYFLFRKKLRTVLYIRTQCSIPNSVGCMFLKYKVSHLECVNLTSYVVDKILHLPSELGLLQEIYFWAVFVLIQSQVKGYDTPMGARAWRKAKLFARIYTVDAVSLTQRPCAI